MKIDFLDQYKNYPTSELLLITREPDNYQAEAVEAAQRILISRNISEEEITVAEANVQQIKRERLAREKLPIDELRLTLAETLRPLLTAGVKPTPDQWFRIILLACGIELVVSAYSVIFGIMSLFYYSNVYINFTLFSHITVPIGGLVLTLVIFICVYRKLRMGWILFYVFNLVVLIATLSRMLQASAYYYGANELRLVLDGVLLLLRAGMAVILWKREVADWFQVRKNEKWYAVLAALVLIILMIVAFYFAY